jgi:CHAT domain-containing protein
MQLPLHAAGIYSGDAQVSCSNYFVASYTPSIAALLHAQQSVQPVRRTKADMLLVAVDRPIQGTPLPMASKESNIVQRLVSPLANVVQIARCDAVFDHIQSATIVHLACHGTQNPANALESSFHLEDGLLPVSRLMELELPSAFLAVLSACETAKGDVAQPDQAIHLASAMLFAGFKSVVATMWYVQVRFHRESHVLTAVWQVYGRRGRPRGRRGYLFGALQARHDVRISRPRRRAVRSR